MPYSKRKKIIYEMNVIPYIDVMLVLLLVFMIAAPLMYQGLEVNLPETTSKEINLNDFKEPLIIDVNENKKIFVIYGEKFKQLVTMKDLPKVIQSIYKNKDDCYYHFGKLGQVWVWDRVLEDSEILSMYKATESRYK